MSLVLSRRSELLLPAGIAGLLRRWGGTVNYDDRAVATREESTTLVDRGLV